jgi:hypothetical protein
MTVAQYFSSEKGFFIGIQIRLKGVTDNAGKTTNE